MKVYSKLAAGGAALALIVVPGQVPEPASALAPEVAPTAATAAAEPEATEFVMGDYPLSKFSTEAKRLDDGLTDALERDLGITAEEYLASAAAAADSVAVVSALREAGVDVLGSSIDGTDLTVNVGSAKDVAAVEAVGGAAELGEPTVPDFPEMKLADNLAGGQPIYYETTNSGFVCSLGFVGNRMSDGRDQATTAGHCTAPNLVYNGIYTKINFTEPNDEDALFGEDIGKPVAGKFLLGNGNDAGILDITPNPNLNPSPSVDTWNGGTGGIDILYQQVHDRLPAVVGTAICKSGATTGWTCGTVLGVDVRTDVEETVIDLVLTDACVKPGDSGGTAVYGFNAMGITSSSDWALTDDCSEAGISGFFPLISQASNRQSVHKALGNVWEPAVVVATPEVVVPAAAATVPWGSDMSGTLDNGSIRHTIEVSIDGSSSPRKDVVSLGGEWSVSLAGLAPGTHSYVARAKWGKWSTSGTWSGAFTIGPKPDVHRLAGSNRYLTAIDVSQEGFPGANPAVPVVYVAAGSNFPDALGAAPAAARNGGPLLLTGTTSLPAAVRAEIQRLNPDRIVVVGGTGVVSTSVLNQLNALAPTTRISGGNRYVVSRGIVDDAWDGETVSEVYVATGTGFADALAASAAAGAHGVPVILVPGNHSTIDSATAALIQSLSPSTVKIAGGTGAVSAGIANALDAIPGVSTVLRLGGGSRYESALLINQDAFASENDVYLATGLNFPDGLTGAALAGLNGSPLYTVPGTCIPASTLAHIGSLNPSDIWLLGGTGVLTAGVANLNPCS